MAQVVMDGILIGDAETKNIMTKSSLPVGGYSVNPYVGCTHACKYCYASFMKRFTSRGANLLRHMIVHDGIHDSGCSLKAYRKECFEGVNLYGEQHRFIPALLKMTKILVFLLDNGCLNLLLNL